MKIKVAPDDLTVVTRYSGPLLIFLALVLAAALNYDVAEAHLHWIVLASLVVLVPVVLSELLAAFLPLDASNDGSDRLA